MRWSIHPYEISLQPLSHQCEHSDLLFLWRVFARFPRGSSCVSCTYALVKCVHRLYSARPARLMLGPLLHFHTSTANTAHTHLSPTYTYLAGLSGDWLPGEWGQMFFSSGESEVLNRGPWGFLGGVKTSQGGPFILTIFWNISSGGLVGGKLASAVASSPVGGGGVGLLVSRDNCVSGITVISSSITLNDLVWIGISLSASPWVRSVGKNGIIIRQTGFDLSGLHQCLGITESVRTCGSNYMQTCHVITSHTSWDAINAILVTWSVHYAISGSFLSGESFLGGEAVHFFGDSSTCIRRRSYRRRCSHVMLVSYPAKFIRVRDSHIQGYLRKRPYSQNYSHSMKALKCIRE